MKVHLQKPWLFKKVFDSKVHLEELSWHEKPWIWKPILKKPWIWKSNLKVINLKFHLEKALNLKCCSHVVVILLNQFHSAWRGFRLLFLSHFFPISFPKENVFKVFKKYVKLSAFFTHFWWKLIDEKFVDNGFGSRLFVCGAVKCGAVT